MLKDFNTCPTKNVKIKSNFHTHNYMCGHAGGTVSDYVKEAVKFGYEIIGISDHCTHPLNLTSPNYMTVETLQGEYLPQFLQAQNLYGDKIKILSAVEIEYFENNDGYYKTLLDNLDYLVMGQHEYVLNGKLKNSFFDGIDEENVIAYCNNVKAGIRSGYFSLIAHPDLIFYNCATVTQAMANAFEDTVKEAAKHGVIMELNANGIRYHRFHYPTQLLIDLCKKYNAKVIVSSDCHNPKDLCDEYVQRLYAYAINQKLNVVDNIGCK